MCVGHKYSILTSVILWCAEGSIVVVCVSTNLYVHRRMGHVNRCVGAIESPECVMRNVDA